MKYSRAVESGRCTTFNTRVYDVFILCNTVLYPFFFSCNEISDLKNRLEVLESTVKLLANVNYEKSVPPASPATPKAATFASSTVLPKLPTSPLYSPSTTPSMTPTHQNSVSSSEELVADLARRSILSTNFAAVAKFVATAVCTEKELIDCSVSGKRSLHSNITPRPALAAEKVARMQETFSLYTGQPRKVFVEKVQNMQKILRQKIKGKN